MAATMSADMDNTDTVRIFYRGHRRQQGSILGPDVNQSGLPLRAGRPQTIRYGLGAVKGTGEQAVNDILRRARAGGPFKDLFDFCKRCDKRMVNRRTTKR
jgi:DNA polymerase III subunit alpha